MAVAREDDESTVDGFLGGLVTLVQPRKGHRAGLDAALLQALVPADSVGRAVDLGSGVGTVAFSVAARAPGLSVCGIERDAELVARGIGALALPQNSSFAERVRLIEGDTTSPPDWIERAGEPADWVLMNPPFDQEGRGTVSPDARRSAAYIAPTGLLEGWCATAALLLRPGGMLGLIHRPEALPEILDALLPHFGGIRVRPVHPSEDADASRVLVTARRARQAPLAVLRGLVLHQAGGTWTAEADAILRGRSELAP